MKKMTDTVDWQQCTIFQKKSKTEKTLYTETQANIIV